MFRHPLVIRIAHWVNALTLLVLLMSGLQIFNAHPALYWGKVSTFDTPLMSMASSEDDPPKGVTTVLGHAFDTTGFLGSSTGADGQPADRGFPSWLTLPSEQDLTGGRSWHFFFAWAFVLNGLAYLLYGVLSGQLRFRLIPSRDQIRHFGASIWEHLTLRFPQGNEAKRYNVIQKLTYVAVILVLLPVQVLAGLAMSPAMDAAAPFLLTMFGGRQSARTVHFIVANLLVLFVVVHVALVLLSGFWNNMRGMLTGWFVIERQVEPAPVTDRAGEAA
ncbi:cytochrome b/b6 domain-containing protein [Methylobacterium sp. E-045]|uniref:cytochrome b/b6 domain-containing protein n=1 Tax=Methylobacterium sp. E-045 TaxID=2836575 RepID=UPI001FB9B15E|nr:cytochrome b/b6 domain-containing protein [Methylobacterium sp. E-045]MCJ2131014.1 cytochrome b/b6 domain-containing protein [Methylobacterium sp. E-045]